MKHLLTFIREKKSYYNEMGGNKGIVMKIIFLSLFLHFQLFTSYLYAANTSNYLEIGNRDSLGRKSNMAGVEVKPVDVIGSMVLDGKKTIEIKNAQRGMRYVGTYPIVPTGRISWVQGTNNPSVWLFDKGGYLVQFDQRAIDYIAATPVNISQSGNYSIKGVVFIGQAIFPKHGVPGTDVGYIKNKRIKVALTKGGPYNGGGTLLFSGMYDVDFKYPVDNDVNGPWQFSIKACNLGNTRKLTTSACLDDLYYMNDAAYPFMRGSFNKGNYCYNNYNRIVESGSFSFEYTSVPTPPHYNAGDQIWLTLVSVYDYDLAQGGFETYILNVALEIFLSDPAP